MAKLLKGAYVPLWHFTTAGLKAVDHAAAPSSAHGSLVADEDGVLSILAAKLPTRGLVPDADLSFRDFTVAAPRMLQAMARAGWTTERISMFQNFWRNIQCHPMYLSDDERDFKALMRYQGEQRILWHQVAATATSEHRAYSLAEINETLLSDAWRAVDIRWADEQVSVCPLFSRRAC